MLEKKDIDIVQRIIKILPISLQAIERNID